MTEMKTLGISGGKTYEIVDDKARKAVKSLQRDVEVLKLANEGILYAEWADGDASSIKDVPEKAMPYAVLDWIGGKTTYDAAGVHHSGVVQLGFTGCNLLDIASVDHAAKLDGTGSYAAAPSGNVLNVPWSVYSAGWVRYFAAGTLTPGTYTLSGKCTFPDSAPDYIMYLGIGDCSDALRGQVTLSAKTGTFSKTFTLTTEQSMCFLVQPHKTASAPLRIWDLQINYGSKALGYQPYMESYLVDIPQGVRELPLYGAGTGTIYNWVDYQNRKYHRCVETLTLAVNDMNNSENYPGWNRCGVKDIVGTGKNGSVNVIFERGNAAAVNTTGANDQLFLVNSGLTQSQWKAQHAGEVFHFVIAKELEETVDIADVLPEEFRDINVVPGGGLYFLADNYEMAVPNQVTYLLKTM